jgi:polyisoprenoid-binding protein YceI
MRWVIDPAHSQFEFSARYLMLTNVRGRFAKFNGEFELNDEDPEQSTGTVTIDATSVDTSMPAREGHLRSADFFEIEKYPTITFKTTRVQSVGSNQFKVHGDLTIKDVTRDIAVDVSYDGQIKDVYGNTRRGFSATTGINRKDFGLNWNVALEAGGVLVGDHIKVEIEMQLLTKEAFEAMLEAARKRQAAATAS